MTCKRKRELLLTLSVFLIWATVASFAYAQINLENMTQLWSELGNNFYFIGDLDGDGAKDIIVENFGVMVAKRGYDGNRFWEEFIPEFCELETVTPIGDLDGDNKDDVLVLLKSEMDLKIKAKRGYDGVNLWELGLWTNAPNFLVIPAGDLNGDNKTDIIIKHQNIWEDFPQVNALSGSDGKPIWHYSPIPRADVSITIISIIPAGDIDQDGKEDVHIVMRTEKKIDDFPANPPEDFPTSIKTLKGYNGEQLYEFVEPLDVSAIQTGDLNGDGTKDIIIIGSLPIVEPLADEVIEEKKIIGALAVSSLGFERLWIESFDGDMSVIATGDLDGDDRDDVVLYYPEFYPMDKNIVISAKRGYDGLDLWNVDKFDLYADFNTIGNMSLSVIPLDIDGDGKDDIVAQAEYSEDKKIIAKRGYNGMSLWEESYGSERYPSIFPGGDLNGDGKDDILAHVRVASGFEEMIAIQGYNGITLGRLSAVDTLSNSVIYAYDLTGDGINDIVFIKPGDEVYAIDTIYAFVLSSFALSPLTEETH